MVARSNTSVSSRQKLWHTLSYMDGFHDLESHWQLLQIAGASLSRNSGNISWSYWVLSMSTCYCLSSTIKWDGREVSWRLHLKAQPNPASLPLVHPNGLERRPFCHSSGNGVWHHVMFPRELFTPSDSQSVMDPMVMNCFWFTPQPLTSGNSSYPMIQHSPYPISYSCVWATWHHL